MKTFRKFKEDYLFEKRINKEQIKNITDEFKILLKIKEYGKFKKEFVDIVDKYNLENKDLPKIPIYDEVYKYGIELFFKKYPTVIKYIKDLEGKKSKDSFGRATGLTREFLKHTYNIYIKKAKQLNIKR